MFRLPYQGIYLALGFCQFWLWAYQSTFASTVDSHFHVSSILRSHHLWYYDILHSRWWNIQFYGKSYLTYAFLFLDYLWHSLTSWPRGGFFFPSCFKFKRDWNQKGSSHQVQILFSNMQQLLVRNITTVPYMLQQEGLFPESLIHSENQSITFKKKS